MNHPTLVRSRFRPATSAPRSLPAPPGARSAAVSPQQQGLREWRRALQAWIAAEPGRTPQGGFWRRMVARLHLAGGAVGPALQDDFRERRAEAVERVLRAHAARSRELDLRGLALSELPPGLEWLEHLEAIDASDNTGLYRLPEALARCRGLRAIRARNSFVTEVPPALFALPRLETLDLSANFGLCALPDGIGQARSLQELRLSHCGFETLPGALANLPALQCVDLSHNPHLHALPGGWRADDARLRLAGTPAVLLAELLRAPDWSERERGELGAGLERVAGLWAGFQAWLGHGSMYVLDGLRLELFRQERGDGKASDASWADAARTVEAWTREGRPITPDGLLELGWRVNGRPQGERRMRAHEFQRIPAGTGKAFDAWHGRFPVPGALLPSIGPGPVVATHRSYPPVGSLPGHLAAVCDWLESGPRAGQDPLGAVERAALLYQAVMSLRPLPAGNAPAALLAMDWALQRQGLPPVLLPPGEELREAMVFAGDHRPGGAKALVRQVARGMEHVLSVSSGTLRAAA
ncbi:leucine-rich repeat domain-containing protein [Paracidovorax anthurii]|uniref:Leucine rich repeat (LRR) protein n=1 Tax=Paracidovorax anthurii TaxID=78229 RepID=A0A328ZIG2_9BURK|nr:leucine-rich repeat domain-containing protein [Paracidovorax anthurii]RAR84362.1 leucine rich repeat (LRR) protein [Paracidovorax anthurii]